MYIDVLCTKFVSGPLACWSRLDFGLSVLARILLYDDEQKDHMDFA